MLIVMLSEQTAHKEVALVCSTRRVPPVTTELIGGGLMEWSRERDRYLNVSEGAFFHLRNHP